MALARNFSVNSTSFNIPQLQLPLELIHSQMQQYQQEKDQGDVLSQLMPNHLKADSEDAKKFKDLTSKLADATTNAFASGNTSTAIRTMRQAQSELKKNWQPGGLANSLQSRYDQYNNANKAIAEGTKGNQSQVYGNYYKDQLDKSVGNGTGYDPVTGNFNAIGAPQMSKEVILGDEVDSFLKGWMEDKGVQITKSADGMWYNKVTQEKVDPNELKTALTDFYKQPHIQQGLDIYAWDRSKNVNVDQARKQYQDNLTKQIDDQGKQLELLKASLASGNNRQVAEIQKQLNGQGYNLTVDGVAGQKTNAALDDYIQSASAEHAKLKTAIPVQLKNIDATQFAKEDLKKELTNSYVPKYSYTKTDIDMIANQPAIAQMKIRASNAAMAGLKAMLFPPTNTLIAPVTTSSLTVGTISQQYVNSKKAYTGVESAILGSLSPEMKGMFTKYNAPAHKSSSILFNAAQSAMKTGEYNPETFKQSLRHQGVSLSDAELNKQASMMASPNNRKLLEGIHDQLEPAAQGMKVAEEMYNQFADKIVKSDKVNWDKVAKNGGFGQFDSNSPSGLRFNSDIAAAKRAYESGDPNAVKAVNAQVTKLSVADQSQLYKGENAINIVLNDKLKPFEKQLLDQAGMSMSAIVDYNQMNKSQLAQLGLDKKGNVIRDKDGKPSTKIESVKIGTSVVNGKSSPVILMKTTGMDAPLALPMSSINAQWKSTLVNNLAATGINPNNPSDILDNAVVDAASVLRFDMDQDAGTAFDASRIYQRVNNPGAIGTTFVKTSAGTTELQTFVVKDKSGSGNYLVTTSSDAEAKALTQNATVDITKYQTNKTSHAVKLANGYSGVNDAILSTKAELYRDQVLKNAYTEPFNVTKQPSNMTNNSGILMSAFEMLHNDL